MKLLLDECLPVDFRHSFPGHDAQSVHWAGLKGKKNGELLLAAEAGAYDVFLTVDPNARDRVPSGIELASAGLMVCVEPYRTTSYNVARQIGEIGI